MISGAIAAFVIVTGVFALPSAWFAGLMAIVLIVPAWEWAGLAGVASTRSKTSYVLAVLVAAAVCWWFDLLYPRVAEAVVFIGFLFWLYAFGRILRYSQRPFPASAAHAVLSLGLLVLVPCWAAVATLHGIPDLGPSLVMVLLCLVWATDIGAFFAGRRWGRRKLAPRVSPGKTVAGLWGGVGAGLLVAVVAAAVLGLGSASWVLFVVLCLLTVAFAVAGDLYESMLKRQGNVKDSGTVLPGHGGALDRIDSLTAAAPIFALGMTWLLSKPQ